jgi:YVTN family beta-propeller protein
MITKCATTGCHNDASKDAAGGLSMVSWDKLFEGGSGSACVIPYRHDFSTLCFFVNTYSDLGVSVVPTMPNGKPPLSHDEVLALEKWIDAGAPNQSGFVKFSDNPLRKKFYVTDQGCDVVTVIDEETLSPMRYISVGNSPSPELPHNIKVSRDGQYWYVIFPYGNSLQKYRTSDDGFVGEAILGMRNWNTVSLSYDGNTAYAVD